MNKKQVITQLRLAKSAHIQWRSYAQAIIAGIPVENDHVPVIHTSCKFGKWYYGSGQRLASLSTYAGIEVPHEMLHQIYMKIFKLLFGEDDRSTFSKIFSSSTKLKQSQQLEAEDLMKKLLAVSGTLLESIVLLEDEVKDLTDAEIEALI